MGPDYRLKQRGGHLVSVSWVTSEQTRASFRNPALIGAAVPGWRKAVVLADTDGVAAGLVADAIAWRWDDVADVCDAWVAEQITGYAEEVQKLCNSLQRGDMYTSLIERDVVAMRLAFVMSVQRRILYGTENVLWELVAAEMGAEWRSNQEAALALGAETTKESCATAIRLYRAAAAEAAGLFDERQQAVLDGALAAAGGVDSLK